MKWKFNQSALIKELELHKNPIIITVNNTITNVSNTDTLPFTII